MPHLFYLIDQAFFHEKVRPVLAQAWRLRSFEPCREFCQDLLPRVETYHQDYRGLADRTLVEQAAQGLSFDRAIWRALVGEVLVFSAEEIPLLQLPSATLCCLLTPERFGEETSREDFTPILQVLLGSRDLVFGSGFYRPEQAGWNDLADVVRLADYLESIQAESWQAADLAIIADLANEEDRNEELALVRQEWPLLTGMYRRAHATGRVIVCEID